MATNWRLLETELTDLAEVHDFEISKDENGDIIMTVEGVLNLSQLAQELDERGVEVKAIPISIKVTR